MVIWKEELALKKIDLPGFKPENKENFQDVQL